MQLARHGSGLKVTIGAVWSQVHPVFMLPPLAAAWFGAFLASGIGGAALVAHSLAIFSAVYTAHVKDGYVDFHCRGEDDDHPMTPAGCWTALALATGLFVFALVAIWFLVDWWAVALTAPTWIIGYLHAPQLDMHPAGATLGYPIGVGLALLGGYYVQVERLAPEPVAFAMVLVVLLAGIKIVDDAQDVSYDRSIDKPTVAALTNARVARHLSTGCVLGGFGLLLLFAVLGTVPVRSAVAGLVLVVVLGLSLPLGPAAATALLIRGTYLFFAMLLAATWLGPG